MFIGLDHNTFHKTFSNDESCLKYLSELKWGKGFKCRKCENEQWRKGNNSYHRRCKGCGYDESPTAHTMFHKCKLGIRKAFEGLFLIAIDKKGISSWMLKDAIKSNQKSAWLLRRKAQNVMESSGNSPLKTIVHVDEFSVGGNRPGKQGRSLDGKQHCFLAVEIVKNKKGNVTTGRAYAQPIKNFEAATFKGVMNNFISVEAEIKSDGFASYIPMMKEYLKLEMVLSDKGRSMLHLHNHIMNIKNWLRGTHHSVHEDHFGAYLNEFHFRFNRRSKTMRPKIFHMLLNKMTTARPLTYQQIKGMAA